jgi:hypothetical protein
MVKPTFNVVEVDSSTTQICGVQNNLHNPQNTSFFLFSFFLFFFLFFGGGG